MIERVGIAGDDVDLDDVFATLTIRHGRGSADDPPLASTCTLTLVGVDRALTSSFEVGDALEVDTAGAVARFRGRLTDAALNDGELSLIAVSSLGWLLGRKIGADAWPAEAWSDRVTRAFTEADALAELELEPDPSSDPSLAARAASETTLSAILTELADDVPAAIGNTPAGKVLVQALAARQGRTLDVLDPNEVAHPPQWSMVDDVKNVVKVEWDGGTVVEDDAPSIGQFEERPPLTIRTTLADEADATHRALLELNRRARPDWLVDAADLLTLDTDIGIGTPAFLTDLPASAPAETYIGMVEGWEDHVDGDAWSMKLVLSSPRLSGYGLAWADVPPAVTWADAGAITWADPNALLLA